MNKDRRKFCYLLWTEYERTINDETYKRIRKERNISAYWTRSSEGAQREKSMKWGKENSTPQNRRVEKVCHKEIIIIFTYCTYNSFWKLFIDISGGRMFRFLLKDRVSSPVCYSDPVTLRFCPLTHFKGLVWIFSSRPLSRPEGRKKTPTGSPI